MHCVKCGNLLKENSPHCSKCGANNDEIKPNAPEQSNGMLADSLKAMIQSFSIEPEDAIITAAHSKGHVWIFLGGMHSILSAIFYRMSVQNSLTGSILGIMIMGGQSPVRGSSDLSQILFRFKLAGFVSSVIYMFILIIGVQFLYSKFKIDFHIIRVMNIVTASTIMSSASMAIAILLSFFSVSGAINLFIAGIIAHVVVLYRGIKKSAEFSISPFWAYFVILVINAITCSMFLPRIMQAPFVQ